MPKLKSPKKIRMAIGLIFAGFLILNVIIHTMGIVVNLKAGKAFFILPADISFGIRIFLFLIGIVISWLLAQKVYKFMLEGECAVNESANTSFIVLFYILLTIATFAFLGALTWFWLPILLLILFIFSLFTLWRLLGGLLTFLTILLAIIAGIGTFLFTSFVL